ncbi:hypothetical protein ACH5A2_00135 [Streptomyces collinus]|uniref:hypothetical protein n=1 Tax=Streptomyces collinus TaxID=42684 RepID=UPI003787C4E5
MGDTDRSVERQDGNGRRPNGTSRPTAPRGAGAGRFPSASLSRAVDLALAPAWPAASVAGCAALLSLVALVFRVPAPIAARQWAAAPASEARCMTE